MSSEEAAPRVEAFNPFQGLEVEFTPLLEWMFPKEAADRFMYPCLRFRFDASPPHALHVEEGGFLYKNEEKLLRPMRLPDLRGTYLDRLPPEVLHLIAFPEELRGARGRRFVREAVTETVVVYVARDTTIDGLPDPWKFEIKGTATSGKSTLDPLRLYPAPMERCAETEIVYARAAELAVWSEFDQTMVSGEADSWSVKRRP